VHHSISLNKTPTWCNKIQIFTAYFLYMFRASCAHDQEYKILTRQPPFVPNMAKWGSTCNHNYLYRWLPCQYFILLMMGAWRPKHVEKVCSNKICILLHHVGVLFNLNVHCVKVQENNIMSQVIPVWSKIGLRSSFFCSVTQRTLVIVYRHFGTAYRTHLQKSSSPKLFCFKGRVTIQFFLVWLTNEKGTDRLSRNVGKLQTY